MKQIWQSLNCSGLPARDSYGYGIKLTTSLTFPYPCSSKTYLPTVLNILVFFFFFKHSLLKVREHFMLYGNSKFCLSSNCNETLQRVSLASIREYVSSKQ